MAKMRVRLFATFIAFVLIVIFLVWGFQIFLLDQFYYQVTKNRMETASYQIETAHRDDNGDFVKNVYSIGVNNEFCISVFGNDGKLITSADVGGGCIIHNVDDNLLNQLYAAALENGGSYFYRASLEGFQNGENSHTKALGTRYSVRDRLLYTAVRQTNAGVIIMMFDSPVTPVNMIKGALALQLMFVTVIMTLLAGCMANLLAKRLSQPIAEVNRAAKKLTAGEYDVEFSGEGYREIQELSNTLNLAAQALQRTDRMQKELIANISHDLRTPLTLITGYCEMMRDIEGENTPENMQVVLDETARLSSLVSDLIDLSKYQSGVQKLELESVDMDYLMLETVGRFRKLLACKEYTFVYESTGPKFARCDKKRILQVLYNLINNAVNYAGEDKTIILRLIDGTNGKCRVEVSDHGEGIPKEDLQYIFDRYYKVDKVHKRAVNGTGLGLSIVKNILQAHGAQFGVQSEIGQGSTFYFEI